MFTEFLEWLGCGTWSYCTADPNSAFQAMPDQRVALLSGLLQGGGHIEDTSHPDAVVILDP